MERPKAMDVGGSQKCQHWCFVAAMPQSHLYSSQPTNALTSNWHTSKSQYFDHIKSNINAICGLFHRRACLISDPPNWFHLVAKILPINVHFEEDVAISDFPKRLSSKSWTVRRLKLTALPRIPTSVGRTLHCINIRCALLYLMDSAGKPNT